MKNQVIDVSEWNGAIDFQKVKDAGYSKVILRVGGTGYGSAHSIYQDDLFETYYAAASSLGFDIGVYFYAGAISKAGVDDEVAFVLNKLRGKELQMPVYYDVEVPTGDYAALSVDTRTQLIETFLVKIKSAGFTPGLYTYLGYVPNIDMDRISDTVPIWMAQYNDVLEYTGRCELWQYTSTGSVPGISGNVDLSVELTETETEEPDQDQDPEEEEEEMHIDEIQIGDSGNTVLAAQGILVANGFDIGSCGFDGIFGSDTDAAVRSYQYYHGLEVDGIIGDQTWGSMLEN